MLRVGERERERERERARAPCKVSRLSEYVSACNGLNVVMRINNAHRFRVFSAGEKGVRYNTYRYTGSTTRRKARENFFG